MAKNAYLHKLQVEKAIAVDEAKRTAADFAIQMTVDAAIIAVNKVFRRKGKIVAEFGREIMHTLEEIAKLTTSDAKDDREIVYTKETVDSELRRILGDKAESWDERYSWCGNNWKHGGQKNGTDT